MWDVLDALPETQLARAAKGAWMKSKDTAAPAGRSRPCADARSQHRPAGGLPPRGQTDTGTPGAVAPGLGPASCGNRAELRERVSAYGRAGDVSSLEIPRRL